MPSACNVAGFESDSGPLYHCIKFNISKISLKIVFEKSYQLNNPSLLWQKHMSVTSKNPMITCHKFFFLFFMCFWKTSNVISMILRVLTRFHMCNFHGMMWNCGFHIFITCDDMLYHTDSQVSHVKPCKLHVWNHVSTHEVMSITCELF